MKIYWGTFFIAATTLVLEIALTRLFSVMAWYHLAFFAVATAMLGMTAGAITVYLKSNWFMPNRLYASIAIACLSFAIVVPLSLIVLCIIPLSMPKSLMSIFCLLGVTLASACPFYFSGIAISAILTRSSQAIGKIYAADLLGASIGCLFALGGLEYFDAPSLILLCGSLGIIASVFFSYDNPIFKFRWTSHVFLSVLTLAAFLNASSPYGIRPVVVKGQVESPTDYLIEKWNSYSRVVVYKSQGPTSPQFWGPSPLAPKDQKLNQFYMNIDGEAGTVLRQFNNLNDIDHLRYDVTNAVYHLRSMGGVCIIGVGGGRDLQSAILFGHRKITGIDVNPIFIDLLQNQFQSFAGLGNRKDVKFIADEARSVLSRTQTTYSVIQMSLIDTWAATGAGAFSLSENALYTVEAWQIFFDHLADDGVFTVSRWYNSDDLGETGRVVSLATAVLLKLGITQPWQHIAMITSGSVSTLLLSKMPFSQQDIATIQGLCDTYLFSLPILPGSSPQHPFLRAVVSSTSSEMLHRTIDNEALNYEPPTDENPYFFNMLRLSQTATLLLSKPLPDRGVLRGNMVANLTLIGLIFCLLVVSTGTIILPLIFQLRKQQEVLKRSPIFWAGAVYFSLIGSGFMFVEIALIQKLSVFLGHPIYALGILLFTIIASAGIGSFLSEHIPLNRSRWVFIYPIVIAVAILTISAILPILMSEMVSASMQNKILASILIILPLGLFLGICFPLGMRLTQSEKDTSAPWFWALNGTFGVLCSSLAVFNAIHFGIVANFYIAAFCYSALVICFPFLMQNPFKQQGVPA